MPSPCIIPPARRKVKEGAGALAAEYGLAVRAWLGPGRRTLRRRGLPVTDHQFPDSFGLGFDGKPARYASLLRPPA